MDTLITWNLIFYFAWTLSQVHCDFLDNTPPVLHVDNRRWSLQENMVLGSRVAVATGSDDDNDKLTYGIEPVDPKLHHLPFWIDENKGYVYLNESLKGWSPKKFLVYVTVYDGKLRAKNEVLVEIEDPSKKPPSPVLPRFTENSGAIQPFLYNPQFNYPRPNIPKPLANGTVTKTVLLPVQAQNRKEESRAPENSTKVDLDIDQSDKNHIPADQPMKSVSDYKAMVLPIVLVCTVFIAVGVIGVVLRKKMYFGRPKDCKDDMRKESSPNVVVQEDPGLAMQQWRGPRAFSNRYESWDQSHPQANVQPSAQSKSPDSWEFPRHRLKFFNILGEGAFGQVWKCEALDIEGNGKAVAVKTLKENATEKERSDLVSELQVMKMLEPHPNVVRLLGCCTDKDPLFVIMEFISKGKLQSYLRNSRAERYYNNMHGQSKSLTSRDLTSFVYQVAKGMDYLSSNGIIHRDLAARNVLITEDHTCKVADFGFARDVIASYVYERKSEGRLPIRWMAPESLYDNIFSVKSDVWSFGVLIWEVVTLGSTPYPGLSAAEVMRKVRDGHRLDKPEHCRRELYNIMYYCWDRDPKQRPSFTECIELLENLLMTETDYIELERFPDHSYYNMMNKSDEKL